MSAHVPGAHEVETASGRYVDLMLPRPEAIALGDVAHGLAHTCRFGGQCRRSYSVAEHAVLVADKLADEGHPGLALAGLHHDDAEAYLGDVQRPLKLLLHQLADPSHDLTWRALEDTMNRAIWEALAEPADPDGGLWHWGDYSNPILKAADAWACLVEAAELLPSGGEGWLAHDGLWELAHRWPVERPRAWVGGLAPETARLLWLRRHGQLVEAARAAA